MTACDVGAEPTSCCALGGCRATGVITGVCWWRGVLGGGLEFVSDPEGKAAVVSHVEWGQGRGFLGTD